MSTRDITSDEKLSIGMNILTPEFKRKVDSLTGEDIKQLIVTPSHSGVTLEEAQAEILNVLKRCMAGECVVTDHYPDTVKKRTIEEFLVETMK